MRQTLLECVDIEVPAVTGNLGTIVCTLPVVPQVPAMNECERRVVLTRANQVFELVKRSVGLLRCADNKARRVLLDNSVAR